MPTTKKEEDLKMKKAKTVPKFKSIEEEANFWDTHSTEDYSEFWKPAPDVKFSKNLKSVYLNGARSFRKVVPIRFDDETKKAIEKVARVKGIGTSTTARMLIRERLIQLKVL